MNRAAEKLTNPIQSICRVFGSLDWSILASVRAMATAPIGTLRKKIQRQPIARDGATDQGTDRNGPADNRPVDPKRRAALLALEGLGDEGERRREHDRPADALRARDRFSISESVAKPHTSDETEKTPSPTAKTSRRPYMSPTTPAVSKKAASVNE